MEGTDFRTRMCLGYWGLCLDHCKGVESETRVGFPKWADLRMYPEKYQELFRSFLPSVLGTKPRTVCVCARACYVKFLNRAERRYN